MLKLAELTGHTARVLHVAQVCKGFFEDWNLIVLNVECKAQDLDSLCACVLLRRRRMPKPMENIAY